jgi:integrator complex subunit 9
VYATEPSVLLGRLFMEEMAEFLDRSPKPRQSARWKTVLRHLPPPLGDLKASTNQCSGSVNSSQKNAQCFSNSILQEYLGAFTQCHHKIKKTDRTARKSAQVSILECSLKGNAD